MSGGWFAVSRGMFDHPIFAGRADRVGVWVWVVGNAAWKETRQNVNGASVVISRGQLSASLRQIAEANGVSIKVVRELLERLRGEHAIDIDTGTGRTLITIRNYDKYQAQSDGSGTAGGTRGAREGHTKETREQVNNSVPTERAAMPPVEAADPPQQKAEVIDLRKRAFDAGLAMLANAGIAERQARGLIAKWCRDIGDGPAVSVISDCIRDGPVDPVSWIEAKLRPVEDQPRVDPYAVLGISRHA